MIRATNYETVSKFVKVMTKILWPLFFRTRCIRNIAENNAPNRVFLRSDNLMMSLKFTFVGGSKSNKSIPYFTPFYPKLAPVYSV